VSTALTEPVAPQAAQFQHAAEHVARAEAAAEQTTAALRAAQAKLDQIDGRVGALQTERANIIARRTTGNTEPDDAAKVALIDADREGLAGLRRDAGAAVASARQVAEAAANQVAGARQFLQRQEDEAALGL